MTFYTWTYSSRIRYEAPSILVCAPVADSGRWAARLRALGCEATLTYSYDEALACHRLSETSVDPKERLALLETSRRACTYDIILVDASIAFDFAAFLSPYSSWRGECLKGGWPTFILVGNWSERSSDLPALAVGGGLRSYTGCPEYLSHTSPDATIAVAIKWALFEALDCGCMVNLYDFQMERLEHAKI